VGKLAAYSECRARWRGAALPGDNSVGLQQAAPGNNLAASL
jgi:hypothetical protein